MLPVIEETLTIREMAAQSGLSEYTLRYYEKIGLIKPIPRDRSSGHRRYAADTVHTIEALSCLRKCGLSIEDMRTCLELQGPGPNIAPKKKALFQAHACEIEREIDRLETRHRYLKAKVAYWEAIERGESEHIERVRAEMKCLAEQLL